MHNHKKFTPIIALVWAVGIGIHVINIFLRFPATAQEQVKPGEESRINPDSEVLNVNKKVVKIATIML